MNLIVFGGIVLVEIFALANRGGGPLLSHLFLTGATFGIAILCFIKKDKLQLRFGLIEKAYLAFLIFFVISLFTSLTPNYGLSELLLFANTGILFLLISGLDITRTQLKIFSISVIAIALIDTLIGYFIYTTTAFPRLTGTFINLDEPYTSFGNDYANFLLFALPLALSFFFKKHTRVSATILTGLVASIILSGFILSFSRGAWMAAIVVLLFYVVWRLVNKNKVIEGISFKQMLLRAVAVIVVTTLLINGLQHTRGKNFQTVSVVKKLLFQADEGAASVSDRLEFWKGALKIIKERPLFGSGVFSFKFLNPKYQRFFEVNENHPHNIVLKLAVENGLLAVLAFIIFLSAFAFVIFKMLSVEPFHPALIFGLGALGSLGHQLLDFNYIVGNFMYFMVFLAIALSLAKNYRNKSALSVARASFLISFVVFAGGALLVLAIYEGYYNRDFKSGRARLAQGNVDAAIAHLEKAENLIFERDRVFYLAQAYNEKFKKTGDFAYHQKEKNIFNSLNQPAADSAIEFRKGEILLEEKNLKGAADLFKKVIALDPLNRFKYYYYYLDTQQKMGASLDADVVERLRDLLENYKLILDENRRFTVITENPLYAAKLYEMLGKPEDKKQIEDLYIREYIKFIMRFPPPDFISR